MYEEIIHALAGYSAIIPLLFGIFIYNRAPKIIRYLTILVGIAFITEVIGIVLSLWSISNLFLFHIYPVLELFLFCLIFRNQFQNQKAKKVMVWLPIVFLILTLLNAFFVQPIYNFNTYGRGLESLILVVISIYYLTSKIGQEALPHDQEKVMFWINTSVLLYFPLNMVFFTMNDYLLSNYSIAFNNSLWDIHAILSIAQYILFTIAIYTEWKRTKSPALS